MTKGIIGKEHEEGGLYHLDMDFPTVSPVQRLESPAFTLVCADRSNLVQWHHRLRHPSLFTLKKIFSLFLSFSFEDLSCDLVNYMSLYKVPSKVVLTIE